MLQRPQTLFLLAAFILSVLLFTGSLVDFSTDAGELSLTYSGVYDREVQRKDLATWPLTACLALILALTLFDIIAYRNRIRQMRVSVFLMLLNAGSIGMIFYYIFVVRNTYEVLQVIHQWRIVLPLVSIILLYLAFRRIRRDELLVRAYERIR